MDCALIRNELVGYHFGTQDDDARERVETHLVGCTECLRVFMRLKQRLDRGGGESARPSAAARAALRRDVAQAFVKRPVTLPFWRRPVPLYQSFAAAILVALLVRVGPVVVERAMGLAAPKVTSEQVDTSQELPGSLRIY